MPYGVAAGALISAGAGALENSQNRKNAAAANQPFMQLISDAQGVADQPYVPYTGPLTAPITSNETNAAALAGTDASMATNYLQRAGQPFSQGALQQYMNPYENLVTQAAQTNLNQNFNTEQANAVRKANMTDAFGYGRTAAMQQPAFTAYQQASAQLQDRGAAAAYKSALDEFNQQGAFYKGLAGEAGNASTNGVGGLLSTGRDIREAGTEADTAQYKEFLRGQNWSRNQIEPYIQAVTGVGKDLVQPQQSNILADALGGAVAGYGAATSGGGGLFGTGSAAQSVNAGLPGIQAGTNAGLAGVTSGVDSQVDSDIGGAFAPPLQSTGGLTSFGNIPGNGTSAGPDFNLAEDEEGNGLSGQTSGQTGMGYQSIGGQP